jgi:uncharacterized membrane protein YccC
VLEVGVGSLTGLVVSFFVLPSRAHGLASAAAARALDLMAVALGELLAGLTSGLDTDALHQLQDGIGEALVKLNEISSEAERERAVGLARGPDTAPLLRTLMRLRHDLVMVGRAAAVPLPAVFQERLATPLLEFRQAAIDYLASCAAAVSGRRGPPPLQLVEAALADYAAEVAAERADGLTRTLPGDLAERFFALGFVLDQMYQNFQDLEMRVTDWAQATGGVEASPRANSDRNASES